MIRKSKSVKHNCALLGNELNFPIEVKHQDKKINLIWTGCDSEALMEVVKVRGNLTALIIEVNHLRFFSERTYKELRKIVPIIIFAGTGLSHALEAFRLDADSFIMMPLSSSNISTTIGELLNKLQCTQRQTATIGQRYLTIPIITEENLSGFSSGANL